MKNTKRNLISRVVVGILCGVIGLTFFSVGASEAKNTNDNQVSSSVTVTEKEKKSEQFYKTKNGKCYHEENCKCLKKSKIKVNQEEIKEAELKPCKKCCE